MVEKTRYGVLAGRPSQQEDLVLPTRAQRAIFVGGMVSTILTLLVVPLLP